MATCPFCAETIKAAAIKCKHCGFMLDGSENPLAGGPAVEPAAARDGAGAPPAGPGEERSPTPPEKKTDKVQILGITIIVAVVVILLVVAASLGTRPKPICPSAVDAANLARKKCVEECAVSGAQPEAGSCFRDCASKHGFSGPGTDLLLLSICDGCDYEVLAGWEKDKEKCVEKGLERHDMFVEDGEVKHKE